MFVYQIEDFIERFSGPEKFSSPVRLGTFNLEVINGFGTYFEVSNGFGTYYSRPKVDLRKDWKKVKIQTGIVGRLVGDNRRRKATY